MEQSTSLGLTIGLPPEVADRLRENPTTEGIYGEASQVLVPISSNRQSRNEDDDEELPCISIQLEKLMGYQPNPNDVEEFESIRSQLVEAMWKRYYQQTSDGRPMDNVDTTAQPPPDFDTQAMEFLESAVARYVDNESSDEEKDKDKHNSGGRLILRYPPYIQSPITGETMSTRTIVQQIHPPRQALQYQCQKEEGSFDNMVSTLWKYLKYCSRPLLWKRDMSNELTRLIQEEQTRLEYQEWTESKRQSKLDHLYSVRETLVHQVELAKTKMETLEEERDEQVQQAMEPLRRKTVEPTKDSLGTFGATELSFPDEFQWLGLRDKPIPEDEEDWGVLSDDDSNDDEDDDASDSYHNDGSDADRELSRNENLDGETDTHFSIVESQSGLEAKTTVEATPMGTVEVSDKGGQALEKINNGDEQPSLSLPFQRRKKRRENSKRRQRQKKREAEEEAKQEELRKVEQELSTKLTSKDLILAQTMYNALAEKMTKIEELLNSLQDEVWEAEEQAEMQNEKEESKEKNGDATDQSFSLLDQVLAMILGSTPIPDDMTSAEHYEITQREHRTIVQAWKAHFGRLPPPMVDSPVSLQPPEPDAPLSSKERRKELGIADNDGDDWEAVEDWDELLDDRIFSETAEDRSPPDDDSLARNLIEPPTKLQTEAKQSTTPTGLVGLRPGGRVVIPK